jgi:hypothetical protein
LICEGSFFLRLWTWPKFADSDIRLFFKVIKWELVFCVWRVSDTRRVGDGWRVRDSRRVGKIYQ